MTELRNAVFIRHIVHHQGVSGYKFNAATTATMSKMLRYAAREGEFEWKDGRDDVPTPEDLRLEEFKRELSEKLTYIERTGPFANKNAEQPMAPGEVSGGRLWGPYGLVDSELFVNDIMESGSNVVESIFTISREWAEDLGLATKADFQIFLRANWRSFAEGWGVIPAGRAEWCAEFHTDADMSVHCHVHTFDRSGTFTGATQIPHDLIETSKQEIRRAVFAEYQHDKNVVKDMMRSLAVNQLKIELGLPVERSAELSLERRALETGIDLHLQQRDPQRAADTDAALAQIARLLPESGNGRLGTYTVGKEAREAAFDLLEGLKEKSGIIAEAFAYHERAVEIASDILGKKDRYREAYISQQMDDLQKRCARTVLTAAGAMNQPWQRDNEVGESYQRALSSARAAMTRELCRECATVRSLASHALECEPFRKQSAEFKTALTQWTRENAGHELTTEKEQRLLSRAEQSLAKDVEAAAESKMDSMERWAIKSESKAAVASSVSSLLRDKGELAISREAAQEFEKAYAEVKRELREEGRANKATVEKAAKIVLSIPEVQASIAKAVSCEAAKTGKDAARVEPAIQRERLSQAEHAIEQAALDDLKRQQETELSKLSILAMLASSIASGREASHSRAQETAHARIASKTLGKESENDRKFGN